MSTRIYTPSVNAVNEHGRPYLTNSCYDDVSVSISAAAPGPVSSPGLDPVWGTGVRAKHFSWNAATPEEIHFDAEVLHGYEPGTDLLIHIHWTNPTAGLGVGVENVRWEMDYIVSGATQYPAGSTNVGATVDIQNYQIRNRTRTDLGTISGTGLIEGTTIMGRVRRMTSIGNDHQNDVILVRLGFHHKKNAMGTHESAPPYTK
jgi:hypothetical protein